MTNVTASSSSVPTAFFSLAPCSAAASPAMLGRSSLADGTGGAAGAAGMDGTGGGGGGAPPGGGAGGPGGTGGAAGAATMRKQSANTRINK